jgi:hypothetical protein
MESNNQHASPQTSRFVQLPREIRDLIYEHILVQDEIPLECAITKSPAPTIFDYYPLRAPRAHRRVWSIPAFDMGTSFTDGDGHEPSAIFMTYQFAKETKKKSDNRINLNLLRVFSFTGDYRIPTAFAFLCDRPATSLLLIKSLELALMEASNLGGTLQAHYPIIARSLGPSVLQYAYNYFTDLCTLLSTSRMRLRKLYLTVETLNELEAGNTSRDDLKWEKNDMTNPWARLPLWFEPLLKMQGLDSVELCWIFHRPRLQQMAHTARKIRHHMLVSKQNDGAVNRVVESKPVVPPFRFRMLYKPEGMHSSGTDNSWLWEDVVLDVDGLRVIAKVNKDENKDTERLSIRPHVEKILAFDTDVYVCCCDIWPIG